MGIAHNLRTLIMTDISGLDKVELLSQLWQNNKPASFFKTTTLVMPPSFDRKRAEAAVTEDYIDYFCGRCIKCDLSGDTVNPWGYDRDMGQGSFDRVVSRMRETLECK